MCGMRTEHFMIAGALFAVCAALFINRRQHVRTENEARMARARHAWLHTEVN